MCHLLGIGSAAHVEKVGRLAAGKFDDVHRRHGQSRAVDHAAHGAVQLDVVEVVLAGFHLQRIFLGDVAQFLYVQTAVKGVVVDVHLGVQRKHAAIGGGDERIDLKQRRVGLLVGLVERQHELYRRCDKLRLQTEAEGDLARLEGLKANRGIDVLLDDRIRVLGRNLLDLHPACFGGHEHGTRNRAIQQDA